MITRIYLVRHGETEWNASRRIQGQLDVPLSERGLHQAARVAEALAGEPLAAVYASDLKRAVQTAEAIAGPHGLPVRVDVRLREAGFGVWEGLDQGEISARYPEEYRLWREDSLRHRPQGGETIEAVMGRGASLYDEVLRSHAGRTVLLVGHGGSVRAIVLHAIRASLEGYTRMRIHNCSVSLIEVGDRGPILALYNHVCFVE